MNNKLALYGGTPIRFKKDKQKFPIGKEEKKAAIEVIKSGFLSAFRGGKHVQIFEKEFANFCDCQFGIATTSGTTALHTAISSIGLKKGDEVLVPAFTFVSSASVILQENATPVFVDIDDSFCMDTDDLEKKITPKTKAIVVVHLFGNPADMEKIMKIAKKYSFKVIEDCAQAHGATINNKKVGSFGDFGCFSFFQTKNMTCGEGGMVVTNDENLYKKAKLKREHGSLQKEDGSWYNYEELGYNYNMTEIQAAIGLEQLKKLPLLNHKRQQNSSVYKKLLKNLDLKFILERENTENVCHNFPLLLPKCLVDKRDLFVKALKAEGVWADVCYPKPLFRTNLFINLGICGKCPAIEDVSSRIINLPTDPTITKEYVVDTCNAVKKCLKVFLDDK